MKSIHSPEIESDVDGDGYVECYFDGSEWKGAEPPAGYSDCIDADGTVFPFSEEAFVMVNSIIVSILKTLIKKTILELCQIVSVQMIVK